MSSSFRCEISTVVVTAKALAYLNKLCRHFSHKVNVHSVGSFGRIEFSIGNCRMRAVKSELSVHCEAPDQEQLDELKEVIKSHFDRFAQKDSLTLQWAK